MRDSWRNLAINMELYKHQQDIIEADPKKTGLFLGTGSGKTRIALELARGTVLIIAPKTQVEDANWERELLNLVPNKNIHYHFVISKETFRRDHSKLPRYDTVIIDECHTTLGVTPNIRWRKKQPIPKTSQLFEALETYLERTKPDRLYLCTATIIRNPMTVWGAAKLLGHEFDFYKWRSEFYIRLPMPGREVFVSKKDSETKDKLARIVQKIGYTGQLSDYFDVPSQTYRTIYLELTQKQKDRIKALKTEYPDPLVNLTKTHQAEQGVLLGNEFVPDEEFDNAKIDAILDLSLEFPRMVIFAKYTAQIAQIAKSLRKEGKNVVTLEGSTKDRGDVIKYANSTLECIFIAQAQVSSGWELPDYPVMIFASMSYSVVDRIQGEGRILRANALKKNLYIDLIVKGGIDEAVFKSIKDKQDFNERIYVQQTHPSLHKLS